MPVESMNVLAPNYMGSAMENSGVSGLRANFGYGVSEAIRTNMSTEGSHGKTANPQLAPLRRAKAREFGMTKEQVGF